MIRTAIVIAAWAALSASYAKAETLVLPQAAAAAPSQIDAACPECAAPGFLPCGTGDVQYGRRFKTTAMQGEPQRAYLLAKAPEAGELRPLLAGPDPKSVADDFVQRFQRLRLVVFENGWTQARVLAPLAAPAVKVDPDQQACFRDPARGTACCLGDGPRDLGCLPKADPPTVRLAFQDDAQKERLSLRYPIGRGEARLTRTGADGSTLYWCHRWKRARLTLE